MLPVDIVPLRKDETDLYQPAVEKAVRNCAPKRPDAAERRFSFMIEDILGDSPNKKVSTPPPCRQCLPTNQEAVFHFLSSDALHPEPSRLLSPTFLSPPPSRYGYYCPASSSRPLDVFTFLPSEYSDHPIQASYFDARQDSFVRSSLCNPSVILDLSNYIPKPSNQRIPPPSVVPNVECPAGRPLLWKHISRNPAKRKGGQIRFTSEQTSSLESTFLEHKYLSSTERKRLATALRLSERQVKTWFQNRRAKWRRIKQDPSVPASSSDSEECQEPRTVDHR